MTGVHVPTERELPPGPLRALTEAIHAVYEAAGRPGVRRISDAIKARDDLPDTVSHEAVRTVLRGGQARWQKVESVVRQLAAWSTERPDEHATVQRIHVLWLATVHNGVAEPRCEAMDPTAFRQAVRGVHGPTDADALASFLHTRLYVPYADPASLIVATTPADGAWVCAFTSLDRLRTYGEATTNGLATGWFDAPGTELVRKVLALPAPTGIVVDPTPAESHDVTETLPLPHRLLVELAHSPLDDS